jgi:hypothetical protein
MAAHYCGPALCTNSITGWASGGLRKRVAPWIFWIGNPVRLGFAKNPTGLEKWD